MTTSISRSGRTGGPDGSRDGSDLFGSQENPEAVATAGRRFGPQVLGQVGITQGLEGIIEGPEQGHSLDLMEVAGDLGNPDEPRFHFDPPSHLGVGNRSADRGVKNRIQIGTVGQINAQIR